MEGNYRLTVEGRDPFGGKQKISANFQVDFVAPEVLEDAVAIDWQKVRRADGRQAKMRIMAAEYEQAYRVWRKLYNARRRELKASYDPEELVEVFVDTAITEIAPRLVEKYIDKGVGKAMSKLLAAKLLQDILFQAGETATLSVLNIKTNEASLKTIYSYWMWQTAARLSREAQRPITSAAVLQTGRRGEKVIDLNLNGWKSTGVYMAGHGRYTKGLSAGTDSSGTEFIRLEARNGGNYYVTVEKEIDIEPGEFNTFSFDWKVPYKASRYGMNHVWFIFKDQNGQAVGKVGAIDTAYKGHTHDYFRGKLPLDSYAAKRYFHKTFGWETVYFNADNVPGIDFNKVKTIRIYASIQNDAGRGGEMMIRNLKLSDN